MFRSLTTGLAWTLAWAGGSVAAIAGAIWAYLYRLKLNRHENRVQRISSQLKELYGPLYALVEAAEISRSLFFSRYDPKDWKRKEQMMPDDHRAPWVDWVQRESQNTYQKMYDVITANAHLYEDNGIPEGFRTFIAHHIQYRELVARWRSGDFTILVSTVPYPEFALPTHVRETFGRLKFSQMALIADQNRVPSVLNASLSRIGAGVRTAWQKIVSPKAKAT
jgi:hypothetical protein